MVDRVSREIADELRVLGFNDPCEGYYYGDRYVEHKGVMNENLDKAAACPSILQALEWCINKMKDEEKV